MNEPGSQVRVADVGTEDTPRGEAGLLETQPSGRLALRVLRPSARGLPSPRAVQIRAQTEEQSLPTRLQALCGWQRYCTKQFSLEVFLNLPHPRLSGQRKHVSRAMGTAPPSHAPRQREGQRGWGRRSQGEPL